MASLWPNKQARLEYLTEMRKIIVKYPRVLKKGLIAANSARFLRQK